MLLNLLRYRCIGYFNRASPDWIRSTRDTFRDPKRSMALNWGLGMALVIGILPVETMAMPGQQSAEPTSNPVVTQSTEPKRGPTSDQIIAQLIDQLGSDSYSTRVRAKNKLRQYGLEAFDALLRATERNDSEIVATALYLTKSLQVTWSQDGDPKEVQGVLLQYGAQTELERLKRIDLLGEMPNQLGRNALVRLARFDRKSLLRRRAAMLVLRLPASNTSDLDKKVASEIRQVMGDNRRTASEWLLAYAADLDDGSYQPARWESLLAKQREIVNTGSDPTVTSASVIELVRVLATRALDEGALQAAEDLVQRHISLVPPTTLALAEHVDWAIKSSLFGTVVSLFQRHQHLFNNNAELLYSAAQANDELGNQVEAKRFAAAAIAIDPFPAVPSPNEDETKKEQGGGAQEQKVLVSREQIERTGYRHNDVASTLKARGRFDWAEDEWALIANHCDIEMQIGVAARHNQAMMFSEQLRHQRAVELLFPIVYRLAKDSSYQRRLAQQISVSRLQSLYNFEKALAMLDEAKRPDAESGNLDEVKEALQLAYRDDAFHNPDILIAMYRLEDPNDPEWKPMVLKQITTSSDQILLKIAELEDQKRTSDPASYRARLGSQLNQYAWLVSNTEGDFARALKYSKKSIELCTKVEIDTRAARLDTCARCYFAVGQFAEAVETQEMAMRSDPYSPQMRRQLQEFEDALTKQQAETQSDEA